MKIQNLIKKLSKPTAPALLLSLGAVLSIGLTGCGQGFSASDAVGLTNGAQSGSNSNGGTSGGNGGSTADAAFKNYSTDGKVNGGAEDDRSVLEIDKVNKLLIVHLPITANPFLDGLQMTTPISEIPGAVLVVGPNASGTKTEVTLKVPLSYVLHGVDILPSTRLPNGDALPAVADGELPSVALQLSKLGNINATVYLAPSVVGLYVNSPVNPLIQLTFPIRNKAKTRTWGYFSTVPAKGNFQGGFFISIALPDDLARLIDDVL